MTEIVRMDAATGGAGPFVGGYPWRIVLHTTEIRSDPREWVGSFRYPSHEVWDYERDLVVRLLDLDEAGKALYNAPGGVETNRIPCIQVEINGYSAEVPQWSEDKVRWIGRQVARLVAELQRAGVSINLDPAYQPGAWQIAMSAASDAPQRMSMTQWNSFNGIACHALVPENDHWDTGALDLRAVARYAQEALAEATPPEQGGSVVQPEQEESEMGKLFRVDGQSAVWYVAGCQRAWVQSADDLTMLRNMGLAPTSEPVVLANEIGLRTFDIVGPEPPA